MMITKENIKEYNPNWFQMFDQPHRIFMLVLPDPEKQKYNII